MSERTVAGGLLEAVAGWGVERIFVCPGSTEAAFLDASLSRPDVELVMGTHEAVVLAAADGHARATGRAAVAYLHANVGLVNALGSLYAAQLAGSPVVVLNGLKSRTVQAHEGFTTSSYMRDYVRQHVKWAWRSLDAAHVLEEVERAFRIATASPAGPVWLGLAQDLLETELDGAVSVRAPAQPMRVGPDPAAVAAAAGLLAGARRPLLVAGGEVAKRGATAAVERLVERLGVPVMAEDRRSLEWSPLDTSHPGYAGLYHPRSAASCEADLVCFLGVERFVEFEPRTEPYVPAGAKVIHTSARTHELGRIQPVDVAVAGDVDLVLEALEPCLTDPAPELRAEREAFRSRAIEQAAAAYAYDTEEDPATGALSVADALRAVAEALPPDVTVVSDATTSHTAVLQHLPRRPGSFHASVSGYLGWGLGAALGLQRARPERRVLAILGDGVFQFGVQALWTAARYHIPVVFLVLDNQSYAAVGAALRRYGNTTVPPGELPGKDLSGPALETIAEGFGVPGRRVDTADGVRAAVAEAFARPGPGVIDVRTSPTDLGPSTSPRIS